MGQIVPQTGGRAVATASANPWADAGKGVADGAYLKFNGNDGRWSYGQDDEDLPEGSRVVGDMETLAFGWMCWVDSAVEEEILVPVVDGKPPLEHELTDHGPYDDDDGWREAASVSLVLESYGDDDQDDAVGTPLLWKTSTGGQVRQLRKLSAAYGRVFAQHPGEFPIIELGAESYTPKVKKHGKIKWSPVLKIVGWMTAEELAGLTGDDLGDDYEAEPAPKKAAAKAPAKRVAAPAPEPEEEEEEPAPRRGRRAPAPEPEEEEEEVDAPAPRRGRRAPEPEEEEEEAPAPRRGRRAPEPEEEEEEEVEAPAPRRGRKAAPAPEPEEEEEEPAPRRGRRAAPAPEPEEEEEEEAPAPRRGRGAAAAGGRRVRNFE